MYAYYMWLIVLLKLLQADDANNDDQAHNDVPTVTVPTSDSANQNPNDPAVRIHTHNYTYNFDTETSRKLNDPNVSHTCDVHKMHMYFCNTHVLLYSVVKPRRPAKIQNIFVCFKHVCAYIV